jgi:hypothetical protein
MLNDILKVNDSKWCGVARTHTITCKDPFRYYRKMSVTLVYTQVMVSKMRSSFSKRFILMPVHTAEHIIHYDERNLLPVWQSAEQDTDMENFQSISIQASFYFHKSFK